MRNGLFPQGVSRLVGEKGCDPSRQKEPAGPDASPTLRGHRCSSGQCWRLWVRGRSSSFSRRPWVAFPLWAAPSSGRPPVFSSSLGHSYCGRGGVLVSGGNAAQALRSPLLQTPLAVPGGVCPHASCSASAARWVVLVCVQHLGPAPGPPLPLAQVSAGERLLAATPLSPADGQAPVGKRAASMPVRGEWLAHTALQALPGTPSACACCPSAPALWAWERLQPCSQRWPWALR